MGEIKQANFRIDSDAASRFRTFCEENGLNQAQGFDHLIAIMEMDKAKAVVPERVTEIEEFERHTKALISAYLGSLELAKGTEERILEQFRSKLESKDSMIMKLQNDLRGKEDLMIAANTASMEAENAKNRAEAELKIANDRRRDAEKIAADKTAIADMLQSKLAEAEAKLEEYPALKASEADLKVKLAEKIQQIKDNQREAEIEKERAVNEAHKESEKALAELQKKKDKEILDLQTEKKEAELEHEKALVKLQKECDQYLSEELKKAGEELTKVKIDLASARTTAVEKGNQVARLEEKNEKLQTTINELRFTIAGMVAKSMKETAEEDEKSQE